MPISERPEQLQRLVRLVRATPRYNRVRSGATSRLVAVGQRRRLATAQTLRAYEPDVVVAWRTFLVPPELLYATGALPFTPESSCAMLSQNQTGTIEMIDQAEQLGYDVKTCTFLKVIVGGVQAGVLPTPSVVIASPSFCSGIGSVLHDVASRFGVPFFYLNLPLHTRSADAVEFVAGQLRSLTRWLCERTGASVQEVEKVRLPECMARATKAASYWTEVQRLRQAVPSPMTGRDALDFATVLTQTWGTEEIVDVYRLLRDELAARVQGGVSAVPHETARFFWLHLRPYYSDSILRWIEQAGGSVVFEEVNFPGRIAMNAELPYVSLAREILQNGGRYRAFDRAWADDIRQVAQDFKLDAAIQFAHENCGWSESVSPSMHRFMQEELNLPVLTLHGDCLVESREKLQSTRVLAFMEGLASRKRGTTLGGGRQSAPSRRDAGRYFAGVDVGSAAIKVVVLDSKATVRGHAVVRTGVHGQATLERVFADALAMAGSLRTGDVDRVVATGVGRERVHFRSEEITELSCHARGVLHSVPDARSIVDIGGQDTKAILIRESIMRMNGACAAGTGSFLDAIVDALGIDIDEMMRLDRCADRSAPIHKTCTVFAGSDVINRIAAGADLAETIRGVHDMVAGKAVSLLRQISPRVIFPVVISGGVARNSGVVRAIQEAIGGTAIVPEYPQLVGALGAALIARDGM